MIATRRQAGVRFALGAAATVAGLGVVAIAAATSSSAAVWPPLPDAVANSAGAARHPPGAGRLPRVHSRSRGRLGPFLPSRRRALAQLRRELDRLPETPDGTVTP